MDNHFLTDIEIKQFKCFTDFKASGFKRVNLIGGKNNIGKTAFMEAFFISVHSKTVNAMITAIHSIKFARENLNLFQKKIDAQKILDSTKNYTANCNLGIKSFSIFEEDALKEYQIKIDDELKIINAKDFSTVHFSNQPKTIYFHDVTFKSMLNNGSVKLLDNNLFNRRTPNLNRLKSHRFLRWINVCQPFSKAYSPRWIIQM